MHILPTLSYLNEQISTSSLNEFYFLCTLNIHKANTNAFFLSKFEPSVRSDFMLQPEENIQQLLFDNDCVILPSFGGFIKRNNPTVLDKHARTIKPKGATLFFNAALIQNDGLLANHIALEKKIPYNTALQLLREWVDNTEHTIQKNGKFHFGELGTFYLNAEGKKWFAPNAKLNFSKETFGLEILIAKTILAETSQTAQNEEPIDSTPILRSNTTLQKLPKKRKFSVAQIAASLLLLMGVSYTVYQFDAIYFAEKNLSHADVFTLEDTTPFHKKENTADKEEIENITLDSSSLDKDLLTTDANELEVETKEVPTEEKTTTAGQTLSVQKNIHTTDKSPKGSAAEPSFYTILAGAFSLESNAQKRVDLLRKSGIEVYTSKPAGSKLTRIQCGKFTSEEDAQKQLDAIQQLVKDAHISSFL